MDTFDKGMILFFTIVGCLLLGIVFFSDSPVNESDTLKLCVTFGTGSISMAFIAIGAVREKIRNERRRAEWLSKRK